MIAFCFLYRCQDDDVFSTIAREDHTDTYIVLIVHAVPHAGVVSEQQQQMHRDKRCCPLFLFSDAIRAAISR